MLRHREQLDVLKADPTLWPNAVEEVLRLYAPPETTTRFAAQDVEIDGVSIPAYSMVLVAGAAANRDPARFPDPDRFDVRRDTKGHLTFGHGIHHCLGRPLAMLEGEVALRSLFERFPDVHATDLDAVAFRRSLLLRGIDSLPVRLGG
jgi:6-deoxyerythronolide B hydroxylase